MPLYNKLRGHGSSARLSYRDTAGQVNEAMNDSFFWSKLGNPSGAPARPQYEYDPNLAHDMSSIPDFTASELGIINDALHERYGIPPEIEQAESEIRLETEDRELTNCPTIYWQARGCHFVVCKTGPERFRNQFFYSVREQYGTGINEYGDLGECVLTLLRLQADHESQRNSVG